MERVADRDALAWFPGVVTSTPVGTLDA